MKRTYLLASCAAALALPATPALADVPGGAGTSGPGSGGGAAYGIQPLSTPSHPTVVGPVARIRHGIGYAPSLAPLPVKRVIWAANKIRHKPYIWGGGHQAWRSAGYDCSGTVSYALHGGGLLASPFDSGHFMRWDASGRGRWITVYANGGHAWMIVAGIRLDTSGPGQSGPRWRTQRRTGAGFVARHPYGF